MRGIKELLMMGGLLVFIIGVVLLLRNEWHSREEAFQATAGAMQKQYRGDYTRTLLNKETIPNAETQQESYAPEIIGRPDAFLTGVVEFKCDTSNPNNLQVFSTDGYVYTKGEANAVCKKYGARVATGGELEDAQRNGAEWCHAGWVSNWDTPHYPMQSTSMGCGGGPGVKSYNIPRAAVNCFGKRPAEGTAGIKPWKPGSWFHRPGCDWLNYSGIEIFSGTTKHCQTSSSSSGCGSTWCHTADWCNQSVRNNPDIFHSNDWNNAWRQHYYNYGNGVGKVIDKIKIYNRGDCCQERLTRYYMGLADTSNNGWVWKKTIYPTGDSEQTYTFNLDCPAGYTLTGDKYDINTKCRKNCASGETFANGRCYKPCPSDAPLVGGFGGKCTKPCRNSTDFTFSGNVCYKNCASPNTNANVTQCYPPCNSSTDDDSRPPTCYKACPSTHRLVMVDGKSLDDQCYPTRPEDYLPVAWRGAILSQTEPTKGLSLCIEGDTRFKNGGGVGMWGPISAAASENASDQVWAYTEQMELVNLFNRKCLDTGTSGSNGPPIMMDCDRGNKQKWFIDSESRIRPVEDKSRCLTVMGKAIEASKTTVTNNVATKLQVCTTDGTKLQRFFTNGNKPLTGLRVSLNGTGDAATAPPTLPEPINREGFLAERDDDDAF